MSNKHKMSSTSPTGNEWAFGKGTLTYVRNNDVTGALRKLKKKLNNDRFFQTLKEYEYPVSKGEARRLAKAQAVSRWRKYLRTRDDV